MTNHHHHSKIDHSKIDTSNLPKHRGYYHNAKSAKSAIAAARRDHSKTMNDLLRQGGGSRDHHPHCEHGGVLMQSPNSSGQRLVLNPLPHNMHAHMQYRRNMHYKSSMDHIGRALDGPCNMNHGRAARQAAEAGMTKLNSKTHQKTISVEPRLKGGGSTKHRRTKHRRTKHRRSRHRRSRHRRTKHRRSK